MQTLQLKKQVLEANLNLAKKNLVISTWGNVSGYDKESGLVAIKASGIPYDKLTEEHMVLLDLEGNCIETKYRPSTDTLTHLILYRKFAESGISGIAHTHSKYATIWAQSGMNIPCLGTTHADYFYGDIPNTRLLTNEEISSNYEINTGKAILEAMENRDCQKMSAVIVHSHGPFTWGNSPESAVLHSEILEYISHLALHNILLEKGKIAKIQAILAEKHYSRKFGDNAYYGQ